jgi:hypothetical protein
MIRPRSFLSTDRSTSKEIRENSLMRYRSVIGRKISSPADPAPIRTDVNEIERQLDVSHVNLTHEHESQRSKAKGETSRGEKE